MSMYAGIYIAKERMPLTAPVLRSFCISYPQECIFKFTRKFHHAVIYLLFPIKQAA